MFSKIKKINFFKKTFSFLIAVVMMLFTVLGTNTYKTEAATTSFGGQLKVVGSQLCDSNGKPIQLKGMSSHGLQWYGQFVNYDSMKFLRDKWGVNVIRAAMYTNEGGYISNPSSQKEKIKKIVQDAIDLNMYVIIDWHILSDNNPNTYKEQSKSFFQEMAEEYGKYPNVIYEICNEPNGGTNWANDIKPYANYIIPAIRAIDPNNIIIVGTSTWSQDVDIAADNPLRYSNIMYTCHFYAGTHTQSLRDKINYAMSKGIAIFVTEWGTSDASGNGGPYLDESQKWVDFMASKNISWTNWALCDKSEASAALKSGSSTTGGWTDSDLTTSGLFVKKSIGGSNTTSQTSAPTFSLQSGTYDSAQTVTLTSSDNDSVIHYTTDGTTPTSSSPVYTSPITISKTTTVKAFTTKTGMTDSNITSAVYTISNTDPVKQVSAPTFSLQSGTYNSAQTVTLTSSDNDSVIHYTTDGTTPTSSSPVYTAPISVSKTTAIKAFATKLNMTDSSVVTNTYTITNETSNSPVEVEVEYKIENQWNTGATVKVTLTNNSSTPINGWKLSWILPDNQSINNMWTANYSIKDSAITVKDMGYNNIIPANGGTQIFGFSINYSGSNSKPESFTLNGVECQTK
ncbi:endoglucanase 5A [Clostridium saccharobutylicum]|uniref:cellulase family glycosylhydrolase n=1 Tax=Clostridium saccharobutylicum TaxID=169679 RepID=UPI000983A876|nr:cellulase family glycosylhydrolase [Clostridium saccharobutylicum]AQS08912.1 endoglucanase 5A [Clostridium saccharobutylicum]MBC2437701.1 cellulase family glycosylhydrolase [Clostridium saccharobutylicum]NSB90113.1 endoglucanase [Clostridium saccharobutylicum]NYC28738.1 endoglucanase [Clostridium saccharobutylicum]OOM17894.1 endoglucanase 5A [Clostridium saccharobutylicum]